MKKQVQFQILYAISAIIFLFGVIAPIFADDKKSVATVSSQPEKTGLDASNNPGKNLMNGVFVLETDQESAAESLERISGKIDTGFSDPENTFKSPDHYASGPFAREKAERHSQNSPSA